MATGFSPEAKGNINTDVCSICIRQFARYTCPRCNLRYCCLNCYKAEKHLQCTEEFHKSNVIEMLKGETGSVEDKQKMIEMLLREQEEEVHDEDEEEDLRERLGSLNIEHVDFDTLWSKLSKKEQLEFDNLLHHGNLGALLEEYTPWWTNVSKVVEVGEVSNVPSLIDDIPPIQSLIKNKSCSATVKYCVINVLFCYCLIVRLYNGAHNESCDQAAEDMLDICGVLNMTVQSFSTCEESLVCVISHIMEKPNGWWNREQCILCLEDVLVILNGPSLAPHALSDVYHLLVQGRTCLKKAEKEGELTKHTEICKSLWLAKKKVLFYLSWLKSYELELQVLLPAIQLVLGTQTYLIPQDNEGTLMTRVHSKAKLIEEIH